MLVRKQGSLEFQSRFTRPLKPFFHHSHGPQHAPSGSTRRALPNIERKQVFVFKIAKQCFVPQLIDVL